jgi:GAF domain-containing protein
MFYQDHVVGALGVVTPEGGSHVEDADIDVLAVLANNAAIAMENTRSSSRSARQSGDSASSTP